MTQEPSEASLLVLLIHMLARFEMTLTSWGIMEKMKNINRMSEDLWLLCLENVTQIKHISVQILSDRVWNYTYRKLPLSTPGLIQLRNWVLWELKRGAHNGTKYAFQNKLDNSTDQNTFWIDLFTVFFNWSIDWLIYCLSFDMDKLGQC